MFKRLAIFLAPLGWGCSAGCSLARKAHNALFPPPVAEMVSEIKPVAMIIGKTWWLIPGGVLLAAGAAFLAV